MPTYNSGDMRNCARGFHSFADDDGNEVDKCTVCGASDDEASSPATRPAERWPTTPGKWWVHARFLDTPEGEWEAMGWTTDAPDAADALDKMRKHLSKAIAVRVEPAPLFIGWRRANVFKIAVTREHEGIAADGADVLMIYLNDTRKRGVNPTRVKLAQRVLDMLNTREVA